MDDKTITTQLVESSAKSTENNRILMEQIKKLQDIYTQLHGLVKEIKDNIAVNTKGPQKSGRKIEYDPHGYCWSFGSYATKNHNSFICLCKKHGHQDGATCSNPMGSSEANKEYRFTLLKGGTVNKANYIINNTNTAHVCCVNSNPINSTACVDTGASDNYLHPGAPHKPTALNLPGVTVV
eukprot:8554272-Ditylum_brightwellii.AAC.1